MPDELDGSRACRELRGSRAQSSESEPSPHVDAYNSNELRAGMLREVDVHYRLQQLVPMPAAWPDVWNNQLV